MHHEIAYDRHRVSVCLSRGVSWDTLDQGGYANHADHHSGRDAGSEAL
jgi:hypothetical protein